MKHTLLIFCVFLAGCDAIRTTSSRLFDGGEKQPEPVVEEQAVEDQVEEQPVATAIPGWQGAKKTIAGLGDPNTPGRWLETPLVQSEINGRIVVPRTGAQAYVTLVPAPGPEGGGSRLSVEAMRALLVPFDELVELEVYSN